MNAIIPARGGSKGVPRKNLRLLGGKPLIYYSIKFCLEAFDRVFVSSEDSEIQKMSLHFGAEIIDRPVEFAQDNSSDFDFLQHYFNVCATEEVALMRPTTPLRNYQFVSSALKRYDIEKYEITGLRSVQLSDQNPYKMFWLEDGICKSFFEEFNGEKDFSNLPRQIFPPAYKPNGHIDIVKRDTIRAGSVFGFKIMAVVGREMADLDSLKDFYFAEFELAENLDWLKWIR